jgi:hypothetical protein
MPDYERSALRLRIGVRDQKNELVVNGTDISRAATSITVLCDSNGDYRATVGLRFHEIMIDGNAEVRVSPSVQEVLVSLGWTPPAEPQVAGEVT